MKPGSRGSRSFAARALAPALASRGAALEILGAVLDRKRPLDEALDATLTGSNLAARDRAFVRLLIATTIRRLGQLDDALSSLLDQKLPLRPAPLMNLLRLGVAQLLFLQTPPHAAVATAVDLAEAKGLGRGKGLVNAVLRRAAREMDGILAGQDAPRLNLPEWLWARWSRTYGEGDTRAIAAQHLTEPALDLTLKQDENAASWAERLGAMVLPTGTLRRPLGGRIEELPGFSDGAWWVQDAAAALPVRLLGDLAGMKIYDLCAAPGGKSAQIAAAGARLTAIDRSPARLAIAERNLQRLGLSARLVAADVLAWEPPDGPADAVLLDAPCTATGTIRRHPDVPLSKGPDDLAQLARLQAALLDRAARLVRPGGRLVYCTCSLEPEEGEAQIARFLGAATGFARMPITPDEIGGLPELVTPAGDIRTLPCHLAELGGLDGFFVARLVRNG